MPKSAKRTLKEVPNGLKPYIFHGLDLDYGNGREAAGDCPFCGKEGKFSINVESGQWRCFTCGGNEDNGGGGPYQFLSRLLEVAEDGTTIKDYGELAEERGLEFKDTLINWRVCLSPLTGLWMVPAWGTDALGKFRIQQLYVYGIRNGRRVLMATPELKHGLFGLHNYVKDKSTIWLCEGPWDAMKLWEAAKTLKEVGEFEFASTASADKCLLAGVNILAVPGTMSMADSWLKWFKKKDVVLFYDNDYPTMAANRREMAPAGLRGVQYATKKLNKVAGELLYVNWGPDGYDQDFPNGFDVRDALNVGKSEGMALLLTRVEAVPNEWRILAVTSDELSCKSCNNWKELVNSWRKAMRWTTGLDHALAVMLACVASTKSIGDQLWIKVIGPPSSGKSTLCEALNVNKEFVISKSSIRGFHSGYRSGKGDDDDKDNSLIPLIKGRTLITKDGDTLLQSPNLGQILSEARDLYDGASRAHYRTGATREYEGIRMTWILCGTASLRALDSSELGERFLDCVIMDKIDLDLEDDILWRAAIKAAAHVDIESDGTPVSQHSEEMVDCMEKTGGYINWLRVNAQERLQQIEFSDEAKKECVKIGRFVAFMRARPSRFQQEKAERELAARLVGQHARLAKCLALVLNRSTIDGAVLARVRRVAMDTARGNVLDICEQLYKAGNRGMESKALNQITNVVGQQLNKLLRFLRDIDVVEQFEGRSKSGRAVRKAWRLTPILSQLFEEVFDKG